MGTEKPVLVKQKFTNELNMDSLLQAWVKKTIHWVKTHWLSGKDKVLCAVVSKDKRGPTNVNFLEKGVSVNIYTP